MIIKPQLIAVGFLVWAGVYTVSAGHAANITVDGAVVYQTIDGFGASTAWRGNLIRNLKKSVRKEVLDLQSS